MHAGLRGIAAAVVLVWSAASCPADAGEITAQGQRLAQILDSLEVEKHWPAGVHVHWESGDPDGWPETAPGKHTHCSAFVASAAKRLGVYILRPPEHPQILLANAQYEWLATDGAAEGWHPVKTAAEAQDDANHGILVVATYHNHKDDKPGHIAIVRPSTKTAAAIAEEGPDVIKAGENNHNSASLKKGFAGHPAAWGKHEVLFYAHEIKPGP